MVGKKRGEENLAKDTPPKTGFGHPLSAGVIALFSCAKSMSESSLLSGVAPANQTKKGQFMNFSQGRSGTKVQFVNRACFPKEKHQNSHTKKWAKFMNFSFWPFLWFGLPGRLLFFWMGPEIFWKGVFSGWPSSSHQFFAPPPPYPPLHARNAMVLAAVP